MYKEEKIQAFDERLRAEEAELERVAAETKADIERIEKNSEPEEYNFEDEIAYDVESMADPKPKLYDQEQKEPTISQQIEEAMEGVQTRIKPDLTEVIERETHKQPKRGVLGGVMVDKGKVVRPVKKEVDIVIKDNKKTIVPKETYKQNSEQEESGNWSKINEKRIIDEEQYRQKIESRINDLIIKIKTGEMSIEDLSEEDQKIVKQAMDDGNK